MIRQFALIVATLAAIATAPADAMELVIIEQPGCPYCARWNEEIAPAYPKTAEGAFAPLRRVQLRDLPEDVTFDSRPMVTPTFVLVADGEELGRIEGYPGDNFFWPLLTELLRERADFVPEDEE